MAYEPNIIRRWIDDKLRLDPALSLLITGVYQSRAPHGKPLPYVVWNIQDGTDLPSGCDRHMAQIPVLVKVVYDDNADPTNPWAAIERVDELLKGTVDAAEGHRIVCVSSGVVTFPEDGESEFFRHDGRLWLFSVSPQF